MRNITPEQEISGSLHRSELRAWLQQLEVNFEDRILAFDSDAAAVWAVMTVEAEARGRPMSAFDSIIAATARRHDCRLVTRNVRDFADASVDLVNPWGS